MTQMDFTNSLNQLKEYASNEYKILIARAAAQINVIRGEVKDIVVQLGQSDEAIIEAKLGTITVNGQPISETSQFEALASALHKLLGEQPVTPQTPAIPVISAPLATEQTTTAQASVTVQPTVASTETATVTTESATAPVAH